MALPLQSLDRLLSSFSGGSAPKPFSKSELKAPSWSLPREDSSSRSLPDFESFHLSKLQVSLQFNLERSIYDKAGQVVGRELIQGRIDYERIELEIRK